MNKAWCRDSKTSALAEVRRITRTTPEVVIVDKKGSAVYYLCLISLVREGTVLKRYMTYKNVSLV